MSRDKVLYKSTDLLALWWRLFAIIPRDHRYGSSASCNVPAYCPFFLVLSVVYCLWGDVFKFLLCYDEILGNWHCYWCSCCWLWLVLCSTISSCTVLLDRWNFWACL